MAHPGTPAVPYVRPNRPRHSPAYVAGMALVFAGFLTFMFGTLVAAVTEVVHPILMAALGFVLMTVGGLAVGLADTRDDRPVPPPPAPAPPPAGPAPISGVVEIPCPNCGAFPKAIDRFGVAVCGYCETRFLVK